MSQYLIMCRSLTQAQSARRILELAGISAAVIRAPQQLTQAGCGYALSLYRKFDHAVMLLRKNDLLNGKLYRREDNGEYTLLS